jgi:putative hydroxymethylpyrimidine transport system ATP-binding protein
MRQRVALLRTLVEDRPILLMDEPFSALDALTRVRLNTLSTRLSAGKTVVLVTHDPLEALRLGSRVVVLAGTPTRSVEILDFDDPAPRKIQGELMAGRYSRLVEKLLGHHGESDNAGDFLSGGKG